MKEQLKTLLIEQRNLLSKLSSSLLVDVNRESLELDYMVVYAKIQVIKSKLTFNDYLEVTKTESLRKYEENVNIHKFINK